MAVHAIKSNQKTVAAAGTPEALGTGQARNLIIRALSTNTNPVYIGASGVSSTTGFTLTATGPFLDLSSLFGSDQGTFDLAAIFCRVTTNGEGVAFTYV